MTRRKVLFHQLPPIRPHDPDVAFPILQGFLARHHIPTQTIYWNVLMRRCYGRLANHRSDLFSQIESKRVATVSAFLTVGFVDGKSPRSITGRLAVATNCDLAKRLLPGV